MELTLQWALQLHPGRSPQQSFELLSGCDRCVNCLQHDGERMGKKSNNLDSNVAGSSGEMGKGL